MLCLLSAFCYSQDRITKKEKKIVDSLSKIYNRNVIGYTKNENMSYPWLVLD